MKNQPVNDSSLQKGLHNNLPKANINSNGISLLNEGNIDEAFKRVLSRLITQNNITEEYGRSVKGISLQRYKNGKTIPNLKNIVKICELLGVSIIQLMKMIEKEAALLNDY